MIRKNLQNSEIMESLQDTNRELILFFTKIYVLFDVILSTFNYQSKY